jgi:hypothetical protein
MSGLMAIKLFCILYPMIFGSFSAAEAESEFKDTPFRRG